jgi:hypothetical protein
VVAKDMSYQGWFRAVRRRRRRRRIYSYSIIL